MRKNKKTFWISIAVLMVLVVILTACGGNKEVQDPSVEQPKENGNVVSTEEPLNITVMRSEHPSVPVNSNSLVLQQIKKMKGVNIDFQGVPSADYNTKKSTLISTNRIPDVIDVRLTDLRDFGDTGIFLDLTPYMDDMPNLQKAMEGHQNLDRQLVNGKMYGLPHLDRYPLNFGHLPMI